MDLATQENLRRAQRWDKGIKIGEGTFANVYKGKEKKTGVEVAIKKIKVGAMKDGLDVTALREVKFLQELHHPNIISLLDVYSVKQNIHLVLEFLDTDLEAVIKDKALIFQQGDIKSWTLMTLRGLEFIHRCGVLHRDLKPNNLLIDRNGELKIADFGLAREFGYAGHRMTCQVITLWYRPPELLWGSRYYSTAVDIWSVGTIFVELVWRAPYLPGTSDVDQMKRIVQMMGSPDEGTWPGHTKLPDYYDMSGHPKTEWWTVVASLGEDAMNFLKLLLHLGPAGRPTAAQAIRHRYFTALPRPTAPRKLPKPTAELRPRAMAPDETRGKPPLSDSSDVNGYSLVGDGMKRKAEDPVPREGGEEGRRVARRLFA